MSMNSALIGMEIIVVLLSITLWVPNMEKVELPVAEVGSTLLFYAGFPLVRVFLQILRTILLDCVLHYPNNNDYGRREKIYI